MILINLLPHREEARKRRKEAFKGMLFASFLCGLAISGAIYWWFQMLIADQQVRNGFLQQEIKTLEGQIKEIATIEDDIAALRARQKAVEDLQSDRNLPVHLLNELVKQLPDGVYVTGIKQAEKTIAMQGMAQSNERVSELLHNLAENSAWMAKPDLTEIVNGTIPLGQSQGNRQVPAFNLKFQMVRESDAKKTAAAANAASPGGK
ncbi:PilN domain-containing protein [Verminephrobacter aporrectodeae]|uniref:PilN domain-containing protein n=1 Tax=Verminephrobacter aporrectodeae TaxID=1110389 RepID=UPI00023756F0|nr:PilN domain-containing protein [Verminephrobacter aporrectodeae]MCW5256944.1 fimbrial protein [Verminephrobacter aporrectodeae subsp. tuberculatae]MCW8163425.1 fimbrial protein [Verminephrobacter aporrectodeae subsp. tuberculatae]MCW8167654.1 fimbrial protein [Verminephrobacter aporrectodeae subsp. tuberculatae]MCW8173977.1 fimbrial protein [Verminephrobacter aporrectodeae subsp. tuberculatae]MCW8202024.1 fimbrial protein [Verminephrobacter aporrectodeae subsp. tuberculatae]